MGHGAEADVRVRQGALRDRGADQRDELRGHRGGRAAGVEAGAGRGDQPAAGAAEAASAVPRVGPRAEHRVQHAVRRHAAGGPGRPAQQRGLHGRPGGGGDPEPDGGGRLHAPLRRGGRDRADREHQRGAAAVVGGPGPGPAGAGGLRRCGRDAGAHAGREEGRHRHVLQGGVGLPPAGHLAGQHRRGALPRQPAGQRGKPPGRGGVDRQGGRARGAARRTGVRARGHGLLADRQLRPLERGGGLHLRLRRPAGHGEAGRGAGGG